MEDSVTEEEKRKLEKKFKRFKKKYFQGKEGFTGEELEECKQKFLASVKAKSS
jgi:hypothetical protein